MKSDGTAPLGEAPSRIRFSAAQAAGATILGAGTLCVLIAARSGARLDDVQTLAFPLVLAGVYLVAIPLRAPVIVFVLPVLLWIAAAIHIRGYGGTFSAAGYIARLPGNMFDGRKLYVASNNLSELNDIPNLGLIQLELSSVGEAERWLAAQRGPSFVVFDDLQWPTIVFLPQRSAVPAEPSRVEVNGREAIVNLPGAKEPLRVSLAPLSLPIPAEPENLSGALLAWLGAGFTPALGGREARSESARAAFFEAASVLGEWKSSAPRALAYFFTGTWDLLRAIEKGGVDRGELDCAIDNLNKASVLVQRKYSPELDAAIANNRGVALLLRRSNGETIDAAEALFERAAGTMGEEGEVYEAARFARGNLGAMERNSLMRMRRRETIDYDAVTSND